MHPGVDRVELLDIVLDDDPKGFGIGYTTSNGDTGHLTVRYPPSMAVPGAMKPALGLGAAVYVAQLCLAERVRLNFSLDRAAIPAIMPLADMLYAIRRWKDDLLPGPGPTVVASAHQDANPPSAPQGRRSLQLWSGGKDSTLSAIMLAANDYDRAAVHFTVNAGVEADELDAVTTMSSLMGLDMVPVEVSYPHFLEFSTRYATNWNQPPLCNTVPFGRDMLLCLLAAPVALATDSGFLSMGHDHQCRTAYVTFGDKRIPRNDVESTEGAIALENFIRQFVYRDARLLPPVAGLSELRILREMLTSHADLMKKAAFCFWGDNCGQCAKCLRYYLAQRLLGVDVLSFRVNPLSTNGAPELRDILGTGDGVLFQEQVLYCMGRLVESGDVRADEDALVTFRSSALYREIQPLLDDWERQLMTINTDRQLPSDWSYQVAIPS